MPTYAEAIKVFSVPLRASVSERQLDEQFFLTFRGSLLPDIDFSNLNSLEKKIGSLKKNSKTLRYVDLSKLPELGLREGNSISFYNEESKALGKYEVKKEIAINLVPSPTDSKFYFTSFNVILIDPKQFKGITQEEHYMFDGLGYTGSKYEIKPGVMTFPESTKLHRIEDEIKNLIEQQQLPGNKKDIVVGEIVLGSKKIFVLHNPKTGDRSYFLKLASNEFIRWDQPREDYELIQYFGDFVKNSELTLIYQNSGTYYVILLFKDRIEKYRVFHDTGSAG
jgi:hypothetical protein